jgi:hypothetical protein
MKVVAMAGTRCPMENAPRKYITDSEAVDVPESAHYLRRLRDGSIVRAAAQAAPAQAAPAQVGPAQAAAPPQGAK